MKRVAGLFLGVIGALVGVFGLAVPTLCIVSIFILIIGALLLASANRDDKEQKEAERHEEMLEAIRQGKTKE